MTLGQRIQHHRAKLNLSQEALGEKLGVTRQAVHKWEADGAVPDTDKLIALSKLFGITLNELLQVEEPKKDVPAFNENATPENTQTSTPSRKKPSQHRLAAFLCCTAFLVGITSFTISVGKQLGAANDRIAVLEWEVSLLKEQLEARALDPSAPLVADFSYDIAAPLGEYASIHLDLLPHQLSESLTVTFTVTSLYDSGKNQTVTATRGEGGHYTADLSVHYPHLITATLSDGTNEYAQPLVRILNYQANSYSWSWESLWDK